MYIFVGLSTVVVMTALSAQLYIDVQAQQVFIQFYILFHKLSCNVALWSKYDIICSKSLRLKLVRLVK